MKSYSDYIRQKKHRLAQNVFLEGYTSNERPAITVLDADVIIINPIVIEQVVRPIGVMTLQTLIAQDTFADGDQISLDGINQAPITGSTVLLYLNGMMVIPANGQTQVSTSILYLTNDDGTEIRGHGEAQLGDVLRWNGSVAGYEIANTDELIITYEI